MGVSSYCCSVTRTLICIVIFALVTHLNVYAMFSFTLELGLEIKEARVSVFFYSRDQRKC